MPAGKSKYRRGWDADQVTYDKLSEYPYLALLFTALQFLTPASERRLGTRQAFYALAGFVVVAAAGLVYLAISFDVSLSGVWSMFAEGFDFAYDTSANLRSDQFAGLVAAWAEVPLFGSGLGATAEQAARINEAPWSYELQYAALLYHTGLVGFLLYTAGVVWIYAMGVRVIRTHARYRSYMIPVLVGLTSFLIANATNQYLATYYYVWVLFLPIAIVNLYLTELPPAAAKAST